ncbi:MAG: TetR/AcrR family transcriptional regulator [Bacteroidota bacterium]|nr:TetR/AcrR family transcriptional regulator [Bacteroidota bacterium]
MLETISSQLTPITTALFSEKTTDRILASSLVLFNQLGFSRVTTASIAKHTGILEGSLWYHFNTKKDILAAHIQLLSKVFLTENKLANSTDTKTIVRGIFRSYDLIWDFRYILRDDFQKSLAKDEPVLEIAKKINNSLDQWAEGRIQHSNENGLLKLNPQQIENLSEITLVIGRYWLDFSSKKYPNASDESLRTKGLSHIFTVLQSYLSPEAKQIIAQMMDER